MNETLRGVFARVVDRTKALSPTMRRNLIIIFVAAIAALSVIVWMVSRPHYVVVMTGLDNKSLGQVENQLQQLKIPSELNGSSILVPASQADNARVQLSMAGLPQSGYIGYSSVSNSMGQTQDQFNLQVLDALQQSLNATISSIDGIESAQVHIVMPQQQLFVTQPTEDAKASVFVSTGAGVQLSSAQVAGIQQLVAHSVKGLSTDNVTVVDQNGVTLSNVGGTDGGSTAGASTEVAMRQSLENSMTQKLNAGLQQIVGPGNAVVFVHANVTFNQVSTKSHTLSPAPGGTTGYVTSQQNQKSQSSSTSGQQGGAAGQAGSNPAIGTPGYASGSNPQNSTSSNSSTTTNYDYSYVDQTQTSDPLQIQGYNVGVLVNSNAGNVSAAEIAKIKSFVASVVGQSPSQNAPNISVNPVPFTKATSTGTLNSQQSNYVLYGAGALLLILLVGGGVLWRRRRANTDVVARVQDAYDTELEELPPTENELLRNQLVGMARQRPDDFASLLRAWLSE